MVSSKTNKYNYDAWSDSYDKKQNPTVAIDDLYFPTFYENWKDNKVLKIGCGTGRHTVRLVKQGNTVVGLDISAGMLKKAKEKVPSVTFIHSDFMDHQFNESSFDNILMSLVLEHIDDIDLFFKRVHLILKKGGKILISELHPDRAKGGSFAKFKSTDGKQINLSSKYHSEQQIMQAAERAGFRLDQKADIVGDSKLVEIEDTWKKYLDRPMVQVWLFWKK